MAVDPRIPTIPAGRTSGFYRTGCLCSCGQVVGYMNATLLVPSVNRREVLRESHARVGGTLRRVRTACQAGGVCRDLALGRAYFVRVKDQ